jgi:hypothetical protein
MTPPSTVSPIDVSIIIINWNSCAYLRACLASIIANTRRLRYEVIVLDAASFDGCDRMLRDEYPDVRFVQAPTNLGFAGSNNRAFLEARGECVLFLNPDTEVIGPAIEELHAALMRMKNAGLIGATLLNSDRTLQTSCIQTFPTILNQLLDAEWLRRRWPRSSLWGMAPLYEPGSTGAIHEVEAISGACVMTKRSTFGRVGGFSEDYFMYVEDVDLSDRIRKAGYRNYFVPAATVVHHGGNSSQQAASTFAAVMTPEAISRFLRKTRGRTYSVAYRVMMSLAAIGRLALLRLAALASPGAAPRQGSLRKWTAIFLWSIKRDGLVCRYYRGRNPAQGRAA